MKNQLKPHDGNLWVVRWVRADGRTIKHRYYRREHDARAFYFKLLEVGRDVAVFRSATGWVHEPEQPWWGR